MDVTTLLRRIRRIANRPASRTLRRIFCGVAVALLAAGCSQVAPEYDPVNWIQTGSREVESWFSDQPPAPEPIVEPPPAQGRPIPNLGTVPPPPLVTPEEWAERRKQMAALEADRAAAAKADAALRARTAASATAQPGTARPGVAAASPSGPAAAGTNAPSSAAGSQAQSSPANPPATASSEGSESAGAVPTPPSASAATGAAPAPVIEVPSLPTANANAAPSAAHLLTTSERHGAVTFGRDDASVSAGGRNTLDAAAAAALMNDGRVRLVPVHLDGAAASSAVIAQREKSMREVLASAGVAADRVTIVAADAHRADAYNVFVDY